MARSTIDTTFLFAKRFAVILCLDWIYLFVNYSLAMDISDTTTHSTNITSPMQSTLSSGILQSSTQPLPLESATSSVPCGHALSIIDVDLFPRRAIIYWSGLTPSAIIDCELQYKVGNGTTLETLSYKPATYSFGLTDLHPDALYQFTASCIDNNQTCYQSPWFNFTTLKANKDAHTQIPQVDTNTPTGGDTGPRHVSPNPTYRILSTAGPRRGRPHHKHKNRHTPHLLGKQLHLNASAVDIGLGIVFALIGVAVVGVAAGYVVREYRKRMRVRRFLQYRQQENEPFSEMEEGEDDEGVVL